MLVSGSTFATKGVLISILQQYAKLCAARASAAEVAALQARIVAERDAHAGAVRRQRERSVKIKLKIKKTYFENKNNTILKIKD